MDKHSNNAQKPAKEKAKKKLDKRVIIDRVIITFLALVLIAGATIFFLLFNIISSVDTAGIPDKINATSSSIMLDASGEKVADLGAESRENITYNQIPQTTIDAFLAIEDSRFYSHNGFDMPRFISSALNNLKSGDFSQGGSTLTMQTIDNYFTKLQEEADKANGVEYSKFKKIEIKIQEIYRSLSLEGDMSKDDIITAYFNKINFGSHARGIQRGAQYYFGKTVEQLNLSESAFLAGVVNAPNLYNPYNGVINGTNYYKLAENRRNEVLALMLRHGYISETEYNLAKSTKLAFQVAGYNSSNSDAYAAYIDVVRDEAFKLTGDDPATTSMKIYTALDTKAQLKANAICNGEGIVAQENKYYQFGFAAVNVTNGEIVAIGPGYNEDTSTGNYQNRAYNTHQTGSSIKPIMDYALTFDLLGWSTAHTIEDKAFSIDGGKTMLQNSNHIYQGDVTLEQALGQSLNTTAIKALQALIDKIGVNGVVDYMHSAGFTNITAENFSLGYGIGGAEMVSSPVQMAAAFSALANGGNYIEPHMITKIEYTDGSKTIEPKYEKTRIMSEQAAYLMSDLLDKTVNGEFSSSIIAEQRGKGYTVYGKTGTSDYGETSESSGIPDGAMRDEWMIGYTSEYAVATWSGFDKIVDGAGTYITTQMLIDNNPGKINKQMFEVLKENPKKITRPSGITDIKVEKGIYPYVSSPEGSKNSVNGMIKSEFANKISKASITPPTDLASFTVTQANANGSDLTFTFTKYPGKDDDAMIKMFGAIAYKVTIKIDGSVVKELSFSEPNGSDSGNIPAGKSAQVCGFYQYSNSTDSASKSNEICQTINVNASVVKTTLQTNIQTATALVKTDYTTESWTALQTALSTANTTYTKSTATQAEVDKAASDLSAAIKALVKAQTPPTGGTGDNNTGTTNP